MQVPDLVTLLSALLYTTGMATCWRHFWKSRREEGLEEVGVELPPLTVIMPLAGLEEELDENLEALLNQVYDAPHEIIFTSASAHDPGVDRARRAARAFPDVDARFVTAPEFGLNPEVRNIAAALDVARYDLVFHTDANVRLRPDRLRAITQEFVAADAGITTCPVIGTGERNLWAAVENVQLSAFVTPAMCFANGPCREPCVVGKVMVFRRSELAALGGLERVKDLLAHDYFLGRMYAEAGQKVLLSRFPIENVNVRRGAPAFFERHTRWLQMRLMARPVGWALDLLANPVLWAIVAVGASDGGQRQLAVLGAVWAGKMAIDWTTAAQLRGRPVRCLLAFPIRDVVLPLAAIASLRSCRVDWRGSQLRLGRDTELTVADSR
jgi:ceramide glucosyltransferase